MQFKNNLPFFPEKLTVNRISFSGGRMAADIAAHGGLTQIAYYGNQDIGAARLFAVSDALSAWTKLFRVYLMIDNEMHYLELKDTTVYSFGYRSHYTARGVRVEHELVLLNDAVVFRVKILKNRDQQTLRLRLLVNDNMVKAGRNGRVWSAFEHDAARKGVFAHVDDPWPQQPADATTHPGGTARTLIGISADRNVSCYQTPDSFRRTYVDTNAFAEQAAMLVLFGSEQTQFNRRLQKLRKTVHIETEQLYKNFAAMRQSQLQITVPNPTISSFLSLAPSMIESLIVKDIPGAMRAADSGYWIWGWDSMVHADILMAWNQRSFVLDMLAFYRQTADPKQGIVHAFTPACKLLLPMAPPAQCLYIMMLFAYYLYTRDKSVLAEYYPFALDIFDRAAKDEVADTGLIRGRSLYPDAPEDIGHDGNDVSVFNNSIYYQSARAIAWLAQEMGDTSRSVQADQRAGRLQVGFRKYLFDAKRGYFYDSVSAKDFSPRKHYPLYAILWVTPFARDLICRDVKAIARFMRTNFPANHALAMLPRWDDQFMKDGNQLGMYMPVIEQFYWQVMKIAGEASQADRWLDTVSWFWQQHTIPEALSCEAVNDGITTDNPGRKQGFCVKGWYATFLTVLAGIEISPTGLTIAPIDGPDIRIANLDIAGRKVSVHVRGCGRYIGSTLVNGKSFKGIRTIAYDELKPVNRIVVTRSSRRQPC